MSIKDSWKELTLAISIGALLGLSCWFFLPSYKSEYVLTNIENVLPGGLPTSGISFESWKQLKIKLPLLASEIAKKGEVPSGEVACYSRLASREWWSKNVTTEFYEQKDGSPNGLLRSLTITATDSNKDSSINCASVAVDFFRRGGIYYDLLNLINSSNIDVDDKIDKSEKEIFKLKQDLLLQNLSLKNYESLYKHLMVTYPNLQRSSNGYFETYGLSPIVLKISSKHIEIQELMDRLRVAEIQFQNNRFIQNFLEKSKVFFKSSLNGSVLFNEIFLAEQNLLNSIGSKGFENMEALDDIHSKLILIDKIYGSGLELHEGQPMRRGSFINSITWWVIATFGLAIIIIIFRTIWPRLKFQINQSVQKNN